MMRTHTRPLGAAPLCSVAVLCGAAMVCAACSGAAINGTPVSTGSGIGEPGSSDATSGNGGVSNGAPKVTNPVDVSRFKDQPCEFLTSGQLKTLGITAPQHIETSPVAGKYCQWQGGSDVPSVDVGVLPNPRGLSDTYGLAKNGVLSDFGPVPDVNGFPAVKGLPGGKAGSTDCGYTVGFNDHTVVFIQVSNVSNGNSCNAALQVARDVTITAKGGS